MTFALARKGEPARAASAAEPARRAAPASALGTPRFLQRKALKVDAAVSPLESEAEAVAERVMRMPEPLVQRACCASCAAGGPCEDELHRHPSGSELSQGGVVDAGLITGLGPGRPLPSAERAFFEPRLGSDLGAVRIHDGPAAGRASRAIDAFAFTHGSSIAFAQGAYRPGSDAGRRLLAHELTHVLQQTGGGGRTAGAAPDTVSRRGPMPRPVPRPPPVRQPPTQAGTGASGRPRVDPSVPYHQLYGQPPDHDSSWHAMMWRASERAERERVIFQGEIPIATLRRGGNAPDFVSPGARQVVMIGSGSTVTYHQRNFHILDAIEHSVGRARGDADLRRTLAEYLPDSLLARALAIESLLAPGGGSSVGPIAPLFWRFDIPPGLDPSAELRLQVFSHAVKAKLDAEPELRRQPLARAIADHLLLIAPQETQGPCHERPVPRLGGHAVHNAYATQVTGSDQDYAISAPEGLACNFDGLDRHGQLWEVKTGYRYFTEANIVWSPDVPRFHEMILQLEEQRARCTFVAARCGRPYAYAFDNEEVARFMRAQWNGVPPVFYVPRQ